MAENKMDIDKACEIISNMRCEEDVPGVYTYSERENTALWMAYCALEFCKKNGFADYNDFVECGEGSATKMAENKMPEVARLFGKKLNEPFRIKSNVHKIESLVRFSEEGMQYFDNICQRWYPTDGFLKEIITGRAVILD